MPVISQVGGCGGGGVDIFCWLDFDVNGTWWTA